MQINKFLVHGISSCSKPHVFLFFFITSSILLGEENLTEVLQAKILKWVAMPFSRGSSPPRTEPVSLLSPALAAGFLTTARPGKPIFFPSLYINTTIYQSQQQCLTQQAFNKYLLNGCEYKQSEKLDVKTCSWSFFNLTLIWHPLYNSLSLLGETVLNVRAYLPPAIHMHIHSVTPIHAGSGWNPVSSRSTITPCSLCSNSQVPWDCSRCVTSYVTRAPFLTHL